MRSLDPDIARVEREGIAAFDAVPLEGLQDELRHGCIPVVRIEYIDVRGPKPGTFVCAGLHEPRGQPIDPDASWSNFRYTADMERDQAIARLKEHEAELRQLGIEHLYLFGSTARGEARQDSDVDLFFDHPVGSIGLYELMDVKETASRILGRKADIMTRRSLHRVLRDRIEASALQVF